MVFLFLIVYNEERRGCGGVGGACRKGPRVGREPGGRTGARGPPAHGRLLPHWASLAHYSLTNEWSSDCSTHEEVVGATIPLWFLHPQGKFPELGIMKKNYTTLCTCFLVMSSLPFADEIGFNMRNVKWVLGSDQEHVRAFQRVDHVVLCSHSFLSRGIGPELCRPFPPRGFLLYQQVRLSNSHYYKPFIFQPLALQHTSTIQIFCFRYLKPASEKPPNPWNKNWSSVPSSTSNQGQGLWRQQTEQRSNDPSQSHPHLQPFWQHTDPIPNQLRRQEMSEVPVRGGVFVRFQNYLKFDK